MQKESRQELLGRAQHRSAHERDLVTKDSDHALTARNYSLEVAPSSTCATHGETTASKRLITNAVTPTLRPPPQPTCSANGSHRRSARAETREQPKTRARERC
jgi:hypothetical protein